MVRIICESTTLKYGEIYLKEYKNPIEAAEGIKTYIEKYNTRRPHSSLEDKTPDEVYYAEDITVRTA